MGANAGGAEGVVAALYRDWRCIDVLASPLAPSEEQGCIVSAEQQSKAQREAGGFKWQ